ncbi:MAG TPA: DUF2007 domain-containing protein [Pinirhizobacter sp.]|uniref:putative signal transducing protein n=1 Tax=Pinirhizobacter sp. TaxID=2950432 RepID=UPI002C79E6F8|nr:DUF2007 domain-containing protein [Pinirhizobacter sp.]HMH69442.1 DUF2007 domain-containing protein [Pinirhizobacter sp.]
MHIVYRAANIFDAHLVKDALERAEIPAFVSGELLTGGIGQLPVCDLLNVMVPESCAAAAELIVRAVEADLAEARAVAGSGDLDFPGLLPA